MLTFSTHGYFVSNGRLFYYGVDTLYPDFIEDTRGVYFYKISENNILIEILNGYLP
jgi:hypothetical protein